MADVKLKPCPFCGSQSLDIFVKKVPVGYNGLDMRVERHTYTVRCNKCKGRGSTAGGKVIPAWFSNQNPFTGEPLDDRGIFEYPKWAVYDGDLHNRAIEAWNRRAYELPEP